MDVFFSGSDLNTKTHTHNRSAIFFLLFSSTSSSGSIFFLFQPGHSSNFPYALRLAVAHGGCSVHSPNQHTQQLMYPNWLLFMFVFLNIHFVIVKILLLFFSCCCTLLLLLLLVYLLRSCCLCRTETNNRYKIYSHENASVFVKDWRELLCIKDREPRNEVDAIAFYPIQCNKYQLVLLFLFQFFEMLLYRISKVYFWFFFLLYLFLVSSLLFFWLLLCLLRGRLLLVCGRTVFFLFSIAFIHSTLTAKWIYLLQSRCNGNRQRLPLLNALNVLWWKSQSFIFKGQILSLSFYYWKFFFYNVFFLCFVLHLYYLQNFTFQIMCGIEFNWEKSYKLNWNSISTSQICLNSSDSCKSKKHCA